MLRFGPARLAVLLSWLGLLAAAPAASARLDVVATVPDLGDLVREIGGDAVSVSVITKGPQDPHTVEPRPSLIRRLHDADLFVVTGMDLEIGWAPVLLQGARNPNILPGGPGYLDTSSVVTPLEVPPATANRAQGDLQLFDRAVVDVPAHPEAVDPAGGQAPGVGSGVAGIVDVESVDSRGLSPIDA